MKRFNLLIISLLGIILITAACNDEPLLSEKDQAIIEAMEEAYNNAVIENESFKIAHEESDSTTLHRHDSLFHHYSGLFDEHHMEYSHGSGHDDHRHDSHRMHIMGHSGNMHGDWMEGHHSEDHEKMEELRQDHDDIDHQSNFHN